MKKIIALLIAVLSFKGIMAQTQNPVVWVATYKSVSATEGEMIISAVIEKGWHTYSQRATDAGPIPTSIKLVPLAQYKTEGSMLESDAHEEFVKAFEANIFVFTNHAEFRQKIKLTGKPGFTILVKIEYMCCNDMMCLPPKTVELNVKVQ